MSLHSLDARKVRKLKNANLSVLPQELREHVFATPEEALELFTSGHYSYYPYLGALTSTSALRVLKDLINNEDLETFQEFLNENKINDNELLEALDFAILKRGSEKNYILDEMAKLLLYKIKSKNKYESLFLSAVAANNQELFVKALYLGGIPGMDVFYEALIKALSYGQEEMANQLLNTEPNLEEVDEPERIKLLNAAIKGNLQTYVQKYLDRNVDMEILVKYGNLGVLNIILSRYPELTEDVLYYAINNGYTDIANKIILHYKTQYSLNNISNIAVQKGNCEIINLLLHLHGRNEMLARRFVECAIAKDDGKLLIRALDFAIGEGVKLDLKYYLRKSIELEKLEIVNALLHFRPELLSNVVYTNNPDVIRIFKEQLVKNANRLEEEDLGTYVYLIILSVIENKEKFEDIKTELSFLDVETFNSLLEALIENPGLFVKVLEAFLIIYKDSRKLEVRYNKNLSLKDYIRLMHKIKPLNVDLVEILRGIPGDVFQELIEESQYI